MPSNAFPKEAIAIFSTALYSLKIHSGCKAISKAYMISVHHQRPLLVAAAQVSAKNANASVASGKGNLRCKDYYFYSIHVENWACKGVGKR